MMRFKRRNKMISCGNCPYLDECEDYDKCPFWDDDDDDDEV